MSSPYQAHGSRIHIASQICPMVPHGHGETMANTVEIHNQHGLDSGLGLDLDSASSRALEPSN